MRETIISTEKRICPCCMENHEVKKVLVKENAVFKDKNISYDAMYFFCDLAEEYYADESQMKANDIAMKDAYRKSEGLLTSCDIEKIRGKYDISQTDLCSLLGWGGKTITRYESHQVQDRAHDTILKKIDSDPEWYLSLLIESKTNLPEDSYKRYLKIATLLYENKQDAYLRKSIEANYVKYRDNQMLHGNAELDLDKVVEVIRYFAASEKITNLYKVKLMKLMWYADAYAYKMRGSAITGLVYQSLPMGAVPVGHNSIIALKGVPCEEVDLGEAFAYHFALSDKQKYSHLTKDEKSFLDVIIEKLGDMSKSEIVDFMHSEMAYLNTPARAAIDFKYSLYLQI